MEQLITQWQQPSPLVGSGFDPRSGDNALLNLMYGNLLQAQKFGWTNAGRTLIDKTYLHILWQAKQFSIIGLTHHDVSPRLESYIRRYIQPQWQAINDKDNHRLISLTIELIEEASTSIFGSDKQLYAASWLLFFLCPTLPIFPLGRKMSQQMCYQHYHQFCMRDLAQQKHVSPLRAVAGTPPQKEIIDGLLTTSNWWQRHYLVTSLQQN